MHQWQRKNRSNGQKPLYTFEEINGTTLRVTRDNNGVIFKRDFSIGHRFVTYNGLPVEMVALNPDSKHQEHGYYLIVREITSTGLGRKTDVSAQNQIDKLYFNQSDSSDFTSSSELKNDDVFIEGAVKKVIVNQYERDPKARKACIEHYGIKCNICNFDFSKIYGSYGEGFIEVHHVKPLNEIKSSYTVDPINDLIPVCSNCHSVLHRGKISLTIDEMKSIIERV
ncbi:HNH endonuclease [Aliivibrio fischeri]|uniref:HNH endonuclease n=1 Tax=Aliivibrio fischeri TaxID=668 RepID=UPI0007C4D1F5|nr:HNH endonuclease [Aliivibrio fischeri]